jgi:iron complex outermembrane recepter protein
MTDKTARLVAVSACAFASSLGAGLFISTPTAAQAQETTASQAQAGGLQEIVVTAQRRVENAVDVPITITALSQEQLTTANVQTLGDIQRLTPALRFDYQTGFAQPTIRGIGTGITTSGGGSNVGVYIDGFYSPNPLASDFQMLEVSSIAVLKGPQGTLFGHNTTGGAIQVSTSDPSVDPHAEGKVSYGRFASQKYQAYATGGVGIVAGDVEGVYSKGSGFITNIFDDDSHVAAYENWTVRTGLKLQFSDAVSVLFRYTHSKQDDPSTQMLNSNTDTSIDPTTGKPWGIQTYTFLGPYTTNPNQVAANLPRLYRNSTNIETVTVKADLGFANFTSLSQYRQEDVNQSEALQQVAFTIFQLGLPIFDHTTSQEFLLTSKPGPRLQWTLGAFYLSYRDTYVTYIDNGVGTPVGRIRLGGSSTTTQNLAGYLDGTYELTPRLFFTAGVRYAHDAVIDAYYNPNPFGGQNPNSQIKVPSINSTKATPRVVLRYKLTDDSNVYASFAEGYKAAILDAGGSCQDEFTKFRCNNVQPEDVHAFEVGYKFDNHRIANEASAFLYNYKNLQVSEFLAAAQAYIINAAESRIYGLEDDFHFNLNEHFQVNAGVAWTHARYLQFGSVRANGTVNGAPIYATCPGFGATSPCGPAFNGNYAYVTSNTILSNVHMQHSPDYTATLGPRVSTGQTSTGEYVFSSNLYYTSRIYFSPSGTEFQQPAYASLAVRAQWTDPSKKYSVAVYGDNVANSRYRTQVQYNGFGIGAQWSAPAIWGVEFGAKY